MLAEILRVLAVVAGAGLAYVIAVAVQTEIRARREARRVKAATEARSAAVVAHVNAYARGRAVAR